MKGSRKCHSPIWATLAILLIVPLLSGCGLIFVKGPPPGWQDAPDLEAFALTQPCTESKTLVAIESVIGAAYTLVGGIGLVPLIGDGDQPERVAFSMSFLSAGGAFGFSAYQGNKRVNNCRTFRASLAEQRYRDREEDGN